MINDVPDVPDMNDISEVPSDAIPAAAESINSAPRRAPRLSMHITRDEMLTAVLLAAILLFGAYLRFVGQNWDDYSHLHPDERFLTDVASRIGGPLEVTDPPGDAQTAHTQLCMQRYPNTQGVGGYFDAQCSTLYPPNVGKGLYVYGELPLFIVHFGGQLVSQATGDATWSGYNGIQFVGRTLSATAELFTILFIFLIGRRLHGRWTGLLAALLYAVAVLPIQLSHFWTADAFSNLPVAIAFYFGVRILDRSRWYDYLGFGAAFGAALASRFNTVPLGGIVVLAAIIYCLPLFDVRIPWLERSRLLRSAFIGLVIAGAATLVVFRFANPHAFTGPGIFGIKPNPIFLNQISEATYENSGNYDSPPNFQWIGRAPYLFAWRNIVEWGMGIPLGLIAWGGWIWATLQIVRARRTWTRHALLVAWIWVYFGYLGKSWVATMRYYMPLYPALILLGAWMLTELVKRAWQGRQVVINTVSGAAQTLRTVQPRTGIPVRRVATVGLLIFVTGFSVLWGFGFSRIYTRQLTRVNASEWIDRTVPSSVSATITGADGVTALLNMPYGGTTGNGDAPLNLQQRVPLAGTFSTLTLPHALDTTHSGAQTTLHVSVIDGGTNKPLAAGQLVADFGQANTSLLGDAYTVTLDKPVSVTLNQQINIELYSDNQPIQLTGTAIATEGPWDDPIPWTVCVLPPTVPLTPDTPSGLSYKNCNGVDGFGMGYYKGYELYLVAEDTQDKRNYIETGMNNADYITISSNRFYDSLTRDPARFPMTVAFYKALFSGQLGYDVVKTFTSYINIGPFTIPDEALPTYNWPGWTKEWWQSEEAFTVYDHPAVFVFKKNKTYNPAALTALLNGTVINDVGVITPGSYDSTALANKINWPTFQGNAAPSAFMLSSADSAIQTSGGTWSDLFHRNWLINASPLVTVFAWYALLIILGWIAWPLLFTILPGLPDRGYPIAKVAGLLIVAWMVWVGGTLHFLTWSAPGILGAMIVLALFSGFLAMRRRAELGAYIRANGRHLLIVEAITLTLFIGFLLVRLGNPDTWAQTLGGEKPMDFAYFNAVLRSTVFPPYDPWYAGGYMNYYYFGFVLVGTPVKLLGIVPSIAYNLVVPMLFAFTGIGAFSVAYNLVGSRLFVSHDDGDSDPGATFAARRKWALRAPAGSPYVAGIAALALCVIVGNLDTPRVFLTGLANAGGYVAPANDLYANLVNEFVLKNGRAPTPDESTQLQLQAQQPGIFDQIAISIGDTERYASSLIRGLGTALNQGYLPISPERWFWAPTRILSELPNGSNEINEFPYFTFVFADLHAHMVDMSLQLLALAWLLSELFGAGIVRRTRFVAFLSTTFGALVVGMMYATNTWDWPTYMVLSLLGLTLAAYLHRDRLTRRPLLAWVAQIGWFFAAQQIVSLPFRTFFATAYASVDPFLGNKTPIWAYLDMLGVFIFLLTSLLVWQTARILRRTYVRDLIGNSRAVLMILAVLAVTVVMTLIFSVFSASIWAFNPPYPIALICFPLIGWATILFFLPNQSREMRAVLALTILAIALTFVTEMVTLQNDTGRQNTIFKLYIQAWILFSVVGGVALAWLLRATERWRPLLRSPWLGIAALLLGVAGLFPIMSTQGKIAMRMAPQAPHTLDGMAYMTDAVYAQGDKAIPLIDDYNLIRWMQDNIQGSPVILEAQLPEYQLGSRITMNTGLPTVLGYRFHQTQQRSLDPLPTLIWGRVGNVTAMYNTPFTRADSTSPDAPDVNTVLQMLHFYSIQYIVVGDLERAIYAPVGIAKFDQMTAQHMLEIVYDDHKGTRLYHVLPNSLLNVAQVGNAQ